MTHGLVWESMEPYWEKTNDLLQLGVRLQRLQSRSRLQPTLCIVRWLAVRMLHECTMPGYLVFGRKGRPLSPSLVHAFSSWLDLCQDWWLLRWSNWWQWGWRRWRKSRRTGDWSEKSAAVGCRCVREEALSFFLSLSLSDLFIHCLPRYEVVNAIVGDTPFTRPTKACPRKNVNNSLGMWTSSVGDNITHIYCPAVIWPPSLFRHLTIFDLKAFIRL